MPGELDELILQLKEYTPYGTKPRPKALNFVNDFNQLVECLEKINLLVGLKKAKDSIAKQFKGFIVQYHKTGNPTFNQKLHTLLLGKSGVGKTILGELLAELWSISGCIGNSSYSQSSKCVKSQGIEIQKNKIEFLQQDKKELERDVDSLVTEFNRVRKQFVFDKERTPEMQAICQKFKLRLKELSEVSESKLSANILPVIIPKEPGKVENFGMVRKETPVKSFGKKPKFRVVTRGDFVDRYQGGTTAKTRALLKEYEGGVLMIDEAYLLCSTDHDDFGKEALGEIINYMSRYPEKITFIFAGYKDEIQKTIMTQQPGLSRRFGWTIEVDDYTPDELSDILRIQLNKIHLTVSDVTFEKVKEFIKKNKQHFAYFGGDTEKLSVFTKECITGRIWLEVLNDSEVTDVDNNFTEINIDDINSSFEKFKENSTSCIYNSESMGVQVQHSMYS